MKNDLFNFKTDELEKIYINSYDNDMKKEVNLFFYEETDTNVMENVLKMMSKMYVDGIIKNNWKKEIYTFVKYIYKWYIGAVRRWGYEKSKMFI